MKKIILLAIIALLYQGAPLKAQFLKDLQKSAEKALGSGSGNSNSGLGSGLSQDEIGKGLKQALDKGIEKGVQQVSKTDGYFKDPEIKIPLPDEAKQVETKLRAIGQGKLVDDAVERLNRAAEDAAKSALPIFKSAITSMTIADALSILKGEDDAATKYLDKATRKKLYDEFRPHVEQSLEKTQATKYWGTVFSTYNKVPFVTKINPDLADYATNKAIDGLFVQVAKEELNIRKNPIARTTDLLKKVFGG